MSGTEPVRRLAETTATVEETNTQHRADTDGINLMQNKSVLENRRPGWSVWWWQLLLAALVFLGGIGGNAIMGGLIFAALIFAYVVIARMQSRYIVTDERVKIKVGILSKKAREYRIPDIQSLSSSQSLIERVLGHGNLTLRTASNDEVTWVGVPDYQEVANTIREEQRAYDSA